MTTPGKQSSAKSDSQRIADLELALATVKATSPLGTIPDHGGGYAQEIEETWSQSDQEQARAEASGLSTPWHPAAEKLKP